MPGTANRQTLTQRVLQLRPDSADLIDAAFLLALSMVGFLGFLSTFDSWYFLVVGAAGVLLGIVVAHIASNLGWHWLVGLGLATVIYFVFGGALALRADTISGVVPTGRTMANLATLAVRGWKGLLTTLPPVDGNGPFLVLVWLLGLLVAVAGYGVAKSKSSPRIVLIAPALLFVLVILLGWTQPSALLAQGLGFAAFSVAWVTVRTSRRRRLTGTGAPRPSRLASGTVLVVAALAVGAFVGPLLPGADQPRVVLRTYVQPPLDVSQYPSPLPGLVKYSSPLRQQFYDVTLATVTGAPANSQVRFTVLDQYTGFGWSASGTAIFGDGFRRVGSVLPVTAKGAPVDIQVSVTPEFASQWELRNWVPSLGQTKTVTFGGDYARSHLDSMAYDTDKGQILVTDGLQGGDTINLTTYPTPVWQDSPDSPVPVASGLVMVPDSVSDFMADALNAMAGTTGTNWQKLMNIGRTFAQGYWSDGSKQGEGHYTPGNGQGRLDYFIKSTPLVGSDEQYAATFALAANRLGYPARVVFGGTPESDGTIKGKDIGAWVEVETTDGWLALPIELYIPDRSRTPEQTPPDTTTHDQAMQVPPPNPAEPPSTLDDLATQANAGHGQQPPAKNPGLPAWAMPAIYGGAAVIVLLLILALLGGAKLVRAHRRRTRGSPAQRIAGGWRELLDRARDMGSVVLIGPLTRKEQAERLGMAPLTAMVPLTDRVMFGPDAPDTAAVAAYWQGIKDAKAAMLTGRGAFRRLLTRINPRSLLPLMPPPATRRPPARPKPTTPTPATPRPVRQDGDTILRPSAPLPSLLGDTRLRPDFLPPHDQSGGPLT